MQLITPTLTHQIDAFIDSLERYNAKRPRPRRKKDYDYLRLYFRDFIEDRNERALEVESEEYQKVLHFIEKQFPYKTMFNLCIDGRVLAVLAFGASAIVGSSMCVPGGMLRDFIRGKDGKLKLQPDSVYANLLTKAFGHYHINTVAEILDSHVGCAARLVEEQVKGRMPNDFGLMADVSHKKQIAQATTVFIDEMFHGSKHVLSIQTSFDPHTGYMYMGLEKDDVFTYAREKTNGFTAEILQELVAKKLIISTEKFAADQAVEEVLEKYFFKLDWKTRYTESAKLFWQAIAELRKTLGPRIETVLTTIYPYLTSSEKAISEEKEERLLLLLANILSGYLHTHKALYPYGVHEEEGITISEGGYPPNKIATFAVFSLDEGNLGINVELAAGLVRKNRLEGRVADRHKIFKDVQEFTEASVPIVANEVIRDILNEHWQQLEAIDWSDLPDNWDAMSDMDFINYLHTKDNLHISVVIGINNLRKRMISLFDPKNIISSHLVEHYKVALPIITGRFRKNHFVVPFVKLGY